MVGSPGPLEDSVFISVCPVSGAELSPRKDDGGVMPASSLQDLHPDDGEEAPVVKDTDEQSGHSDEAQVLHDEESNANDEDEEEVEDHEDEEEAEDYEDDDDDGSVIINCICDINEVRDDMLIQCTDCGYAFHFQCCNLDEKVSYMYSIYFIYLYKAPCLSI